MYAIGDFVTVVGSSDETFPTAFLGKTGQIDQVYTSGFNSTESDPYYRVAFSEDIGEGSRPDRNGFWGEELELVTPDSADFDSEFKDLFRSEDAFETTWLMFKSWSPDWRSQAALLDDLEPDEIPAHESEEDWGGYNFQENPDYIGEGSKVGVYQHPWDRDFVVKVPHHDDTWSNRQFEGRNERDSIIEILEKLGYPIMGELQHPEGYSIQPKLEAYSPGGWQQAQKKIADRTLMHLVSDRHNRNWGVDPTLDTVRNFDMDSLGVGHDWLPVAGDSRSKLPVAGDSRGKDYQEMLDTYGIQHPASRILNEIPKVDRNRRDDPNYKFQSFRNVMEMIEPYSDNPDTLTLDGKPYWLEGSE